MQNSCRCKKPVIAEKRFTIHDAPAVLTIHLKRFSPLGRKIGHFVNYDERITLKPFMSEGQFGPTYSLYGVICHAGGGPNSGHYYAMVKGANGTWYEMNDESVSLHRGAPMTLKNAYMLFYIREKGQSLEAAISRPSMTPRSIVAGMKKRKALDSEDDDDLGVKTNRPFIGPLLPSPMTNDAEVHKKPKMDDKDPQAESIKKKIEATKKVPSTSTALTSLSQYNDDDDDDSESPLATPVDLKPPSSTAESVTTSSPPPCPPTSPPPPISATASTSSISSIQSNNTPSSGISPSTFYSSHKNDKKRKSPDGDDDERTPQKHYARVPLHPQSSKHGHNRRKSSFGGGAKAINPYGLLAGSNTLHRIENCRPAHRYGKKKRMIM